jgi:hypothetical protein
LGQNTKGVLSFSPAFGKILRSKTENGFFGLLCGEKLDKAVVGKLFSEFLVILVINAAMAG